MRDGKKINWKSGSADFFHSDLRQQMIIEQKKRFLSGSSVDTGVVSTMVLESWKRSKKHGVQVEDCKQSMIDSALLSHLISINQPLLECANDIFKHMFFASGAMASIMTVSSAEGVVLSTHSLAGSEHSVPNAVLGNISRENRIGTNAIGTCLAESTPVEIIGAEHYREGGYRWSCSAAPIVDEQARTIATLNVSQPREQYHTHTLGMVKAAAYAIGEQLRLRILLQQQSTITELLDDGILVLARNGTIRLMNQKMASMLGLNTPCVGGQVFSYISDSPLLRRILELSEAENDQEARFAFPSGSIGCVYSAIPISLDGGVILTFRESRRLRRIAVQITGNRAVYTFQSIIGNSPALRDAIGEANMVAPNNTTVLLLGESGTGKELFAQSIHNASRNASGPFVAVNCGAIPRNLLESELFGYEDGAFTGASRMGKPGKFELAAGGTIFLDEIGEMPMDAQVALLRLLQNSEVTRVGAKSSREVKVRVIAATNKDLEQAVKDKCFREDLYYRLNVFSIFIPALRNRPGDVEILSRHFLKHFAKGLARQIEGFDDEVMQALRTYRWPGNVRELENIIERMANVAKQPTITMQDITPQFRINLGNTITYDKAKSPNATNHHSAPLSAAPLAPRTNLHSHTMEVREAKDRHEGEHISTLLTQFKGNIRQAAATLGLSRAGLYQKLRRLGLKPEDFRHN